MPFEKLKTAFATSGKNRERFQGRKGKVELALGAANVNITDWESSGADGHAPYRERHTALSSKLTDAERQSTDNPGDAYRALDTVKQAARALDEEVSRILLTPEFQQVLQELKDDGSTIPLKGMCVNVGNTIRDLLNGRSAYYPLSEISFEIKLVINIPKKAYKTLSSLVLQEGYDQASPILKDHALKAAEAIGAYNAYLQETQPVDFKQALLLHGEIAKALKTIQETLPGRIRMAFTAGIERAKATSDAYRTYQISCTLETAGTITAIGIGIAGIAGSPFTFGFSAVIAIWALFKSTVALAQQIANALTSTETQINFAKRLFNEQRTKLETHTRTYNTRAEVGVTFVSFLTGSAWFQGANAAKDEIHLGLNKNNGDFTSLRKMAQDLDALLEKLDRFASECNGQTDHPEVVTAGGKLKKLNLTQSIEKIQRLYPVVNAREEWCISAETQLSELTEEKINSTVVTGVDVTLKIVDFGLGVGANAASLDMSEAANEIKLVQDTFRDALVAADGEFANALK